MVGIVLYWVSSEFLTQMVSSQLVFNLLSSQECIHRLYHWEEWLPRLVWSRSGNLPHQHIKAGLLLDWWLLDLILQQRCQASHRLICTQVYAWTYWANKPISFPPGKWLSDFSSQTKIFTALVLSANKAWIKFTLVPWQRMEVCYGKLIITWL